MPNPKKLTVGTGEPPARPYAQRIYAETRAEPIQDSKKEDAKLRSVDDILLKSRLELWQVFDP